MNAFGLNSIGDYLSQANNNTAVIIQIETLASYENVEAFAKVPGVGTVPNPLAFFNPLSPSFVSAPLSPILLPLTFPNLVCY